MYYPYVLKELHHRQNRTIVNIVGIAVGIALFVAINAVSAAYDEAVSRPFKNLGADLIVQRAEATKAAMAQKPGSMRGVRLPFSNQLLTREDIETVKAVEGVEGTAAALLLWEFSERGFKTIMGVDLERPDLGPIKVGEWIQEGRFPTASGEVVLESHFARFQKTKLGDTFTIGAFPFTVVGLLEIKEGAQIAAANVYLSLKDAQKLLPIESGQFGAVNMVYLRLRDPSMLRQIKETISEKLGGISVSSSEAFLELMGGISQVSERFSLIASVVALAGAVLLIIKTMLANLVERSREIGILKTVGWCQRDIQKQLLGEALLQSVMGGLIGVMVGYIICYLLSFLSISTPIPWALNPVPAMAKDAQHVVEAISLPVRVSSALAVFSLAMSIAIGAMASCFLAYRTAKIKPADVLRKM
jgi:putative ABC transport system permease protein